VNERKRKDDIEKTNKKTGRRERMIQKRRQWKREVMIWKGEWMTGERYRMAGKNERESKMRGRKGWQ
jgi:hypothetical protein